MGFKRVLFVQAKYDSTFSNVLPAGIGYLSEFLDSKGITNDVFDLNVARNTEEKLREKIKSFSPDLVAFSMMSLNYKYNYDVMRGIKRSMPGIKIAAGGAHISTMRQDVLRDCAEIDYGVVLEGEYTLLELCSGDRPLTDIKGLIHRSQGAVVYNGDRPFIRDLDSLPFPTYAKFDKGDYLPLMSVFSSRGCPFECTYCPVKLAIGRRFVTRSPKSVVDEMEFHYRRGCRQFSFRDDNFTLEQDRVYKICDEIDARGLTGLYLMCDNGVRADKIDSKLLARMKASGFRMIGLGVESGSDEVLKRLKKSSTVSDMEKAIKAACDLGYIVELFLLIGAPGETWQDFEKTVELAGRYPVQAASFYHILPYPNTELFDEAKRDKYLLRSPEEYLNDGSQRRNTPFLSTPEFPYELRKKAFDYAYRATAASTKNARREYSRRNVREKLERRGVSSALASMVANIYTIDFIYSSLSNNALAVNLKKYLSRQKAVSR
jgi:anaerobic magnesium-protoporphyrin IX monomethyl ester cyclase